MHIMLWALCILYGKDGGPSQRWLTLKGSGRNSENHKGKPLVTARPEAFEKSQTEVNVRMHQPHLSITIPKCECQTIIAGASGTVNEL